MARVTSVKESDARGGGQLHPTEVVCEWSVFGDQTRILQLDSRGSSEREIVGKLSQTLQFDRAAAEQLLQVLHKTFPGLRADLSQPGN